MKSGGSNCGCRIATPDEHSKNPLAMVGGHMDIGTISGYIMLPICKNHNHKKFNRKTKGGRVSGTDEMQRKSYWNQDYY
jgi:hypothetical protein